MASKNKHYVLYYTSCHSWSYRFWADYYSQYVSKDSWEKRLMTREELVTFLSHRVDELEKHLVKGCKTGLLKYEFIRKSTCSYPGVRDYEIKYHTWYCIKIIRNNEEYDVNYDALIKEAFEKKKKLDKRNKTYRRLPKRINWKDRNKCKHQYEVHMNPHKDTYKGE